MKKPTLKQLLPILKFSKKCTRPLLAFSGLVKDNSLLISDFETSLEIKNVDLKNGLHNIETINLMNSSINNDSVNEYPLIAFESSKNVLNVSLKELISLMVFVSKDETRLFLNGVAWIKNELCATNGHVMKVITGKSENENDSILPATSIKVLIRLMKKYKMNSIDLMVSDEYFTAINENFNFRGRLIQRDYPKYTAVIPVKTSKKIEITEKIDFKELKPALNKNTFVSNLVIEKKEVFLVVPLTEIKIKVGKTSHKKLDPIGFNLKYLCEILENSDNNILEFNNSLSAFIVNNNNGCSIIMPMKI